MEGWEIASKLASTLNQNLARITHRVCDRHDRLASCGDIWELLVLGGAMCCCRNVDSHPSCYSQCSHGNFVEENFLKRTRFHALGMLFCIASASSVQAEEEVAATPYRPTVSTPAALSAPGWFELELGGQHSHASGNSTRDSVPLSLKYALTEDWGVRIGGEAWIRDTTEGTTSAGLGDTNVVLKHRFVLNDSAAFGLEGGANFPTAHNGLGSGKTDYLINGIYSLDFSGLHTDLNLGLTHVGSVTTESRWLANWAASLSGPVSPQWGWAAELSGTHQRGAPDTRQVLAAASYSYSKRVVFDGGMAFGLTPDSADWIAFLGVTIVLGKLP